MHSRVFIPAPIASAVDH